MHSVIVRGRRPYIVRVLYGRNSQVTSRRENVKSFVVTPGCVDTQVEPATRVEIRHNGEKEGGPIEYINNIGVGGPGDCNGRSRETGASLSGKICGILSMLYHWTRVIVHNRSNLYFHFDQCEIFKCFIWINMFLFY